MRLTLALSCFWAVIASWVTVSSSPMVVVREVMMAGDRAASGWFSRGVQHGPHHGLGGEEGSREGGRRMVLCCWQALGRCRPPPSAVICYQLP